LGVLKTVNFFSRFEPKQTETQSVSVVFRFAFSGHPTKIFQFVSVCFDVLDQYWNKRNKQNLWYGMVWCPWNNQIFFLIRTETNRNSICFGCFLICFVKPKIIFFGLFSCFGLVSKQPKQTEFSLNKPKKSLKSLGVLKTVNFFSRFEPKQTETQSVSVVIWFAFSGHPKKIFWFVSVCFYVLDQYWNKWNKQNLWYGELKRLIF
jgi:hypothetical protein